MITGMDSYAGPAPGWHDHAMAAECAAIGREFTGWGVTWTSAQGFRARKGGDEIGPCSSRTALRCMLALTELRASRRAAWRAAQ